MNSFFSYFFKVSLFQLLVVDRQLHLEHISSFPCIGVSFTNSVFSKFVCLLSVSFYFQEKNLVDMCCSNSDVWAVWRESDGGECVKHLTYDGCVGICWCASCTQFCV